MKKELKKIKKCGRKKSKEGYKKIQRKKKVDGKKKGWEEEQEGLRLEPWWSNKGLCPCFLSFASPAVSICEQIGC